MEMGARGWHLPAGTGNGAGRASPRRRRSRPAGGWWPSPRTVPGSGASQAQIDARFVRQ